MTRCPDCDGHMEYDTDSEKYYCAKCEKHWEPDEVESRKTIYQDTTENPMPDTIFYWDEKARGGHEEDEEDEEDEEEAEE